MVAHGLAPAGRLIVQPASDTGRVQPLDGALVGLASMNDRIFLRDLRIETVIGIYDWERAIRQTVSFDFEFPADIRQAARTDNIADTLDYKSVAKTVIAFVEASHYGLVETLAEEVARLILREFSLPWVKIVLNKPGAVRGSRDVGVMIERSRIDFGL